VRKSKLSFRDSGRQTFNLVEDNEDGLLDFDMFENMAPQFDYIGPSAEGKTQTYVPGMAVFTIMEVEGDEEEEY